MEYNKPTLPEIVPAMNSPDHSLGINGPAESMYKRLVRSVIEFEDNLPGDAEVGILLLNSGMGASIILDDLGYYGEDMILIAGSGLDGADLQTIFHYTQLNLTLISIKCHDRLPKRIAKYLTERINE